MRPRNWRSPFWRWIELDLHSAMIVLHPGFAKTATKTLQHSVFPGHEQINYLGLPAPSPAADAAIHDIAKCDSTKFNLAAAKEAFAPLLRNAMEGSTTILSYENFCLYESVDKGLIAHRLKEIFGPCRILFTLRRQEDLLASWYLQKIGKYLTGNNFVSFSSWFQIKMLEPHKSILNDLDFDSVISTYEAIFGEDNVHVMLFEQLRKDHGAYARELARVLGVDSTQVGRLLAATHNPTITQRRIDFGRLATRYLPRIAMKGGAPRIPRRARRRFQRFLSGGPGARIEIGAEAEDWIGDHCSAGNKALNARYANRLAEFGYTL